MTIDQNKMTEKAAKMIKRRRTVHLPGDQTNPMVTELMFVFGKTKQDIADYVGTHRNNVNAWVRGYYQPNEHHEEKLLEMVQTERILIKTK